MNGDSPYLFSTISPSKHGKPFLQLMPFFKSDNALQDLKSYLQIRESRYNVAEQQTAVFLSLLTGSSGKINRLTVRAAQKMMERYAKAYGKPGVSMHKLRHSFATKFNKENNNLEMLKEQLGHTDVNMTMVYTKIGNEVSGKSLNEPNI
ncbi:tyrosine-type recombinase/integrase [Paenibacillus sp. SEL3]